MLVRIYIDLRENGVIRNSQGVISMTIKLPSNTTKVTYKRKGYGNETVEKLPHAAPPKRYLDANWHPFAEFKIGDTHASLGNDRFLASDEAEIFYYVAEDILIGSGANTRSEYDLFDFWHLHHVLVSAALHERGNDLIVISGF